MNKRVLRSSLLFLMAVLIAIYFRIWLLLSFSSSASPTREQKREVYNTSPFSNDASMIGTTKIIAFCNHNYRSVALAWYRRMTRLGYSTHVIVATDRLMAEFLRSNTDFRYQILIHEPMAVENVSSNNKKKTEQDHDLLKLLMAVRWKFLLQQLNKGIHILLTDVDNIFTRYIPMKELENYDKNVDVWHAYATKYPRKAFAKLGFVVCSGMSWWRASPAAVRFSQIMHDTCGILCDDQRVLNNLLTGDKLNMTWHWTPEIEASRIISVAEKDNRFVGLPTVGISGVSNVTGHRARVWERDFAFRGPLRPDTCPRNNWVSMPILEAKSRGTAWKTKLESFREWDGYCPQ